LLVPAENLAPGPCGHRIHVIDFDSSTGHFYPPARVNGGGDPYEKADDGQLLSDPHFHCQNVYAIAMCTLARFEHALGRRLGWGFGTHRLKVAPHAFADANAFYSRREEAVLFGYFRGRSGRRVFSALSHDVVAHETTHALLDGLRDRYVEPSSPDQAAFHEGFADVVALLSILSLGPVVRYALTHQSHGPKILSAPQRVRVGVLNQKVLSQTVLFGLAEQMGLEMEEVGASALRRSIALQPDEVARDGSENEAHARGEIFVAAMMQAFIAVWLRRLEPIVAGRRETDLERVVEEGTGAAGRLLTMAIRALDYSPAVDLHFSDYLTALLTADLEFMPDDERYQYRAVLTTQFARFGIRPVTREGYWKRFDGSASTERCHLDVLQRDPDEMHRFIWENREVLEVDPAFYTRVLSVRPCLRIGADGFALQETVAEYVQIVDLRAGELRRTLGIKKPKSIGASEPVRVYGGGVLIFDEFGQLKYHVQSRLKSSKQTDRLENLARRGLTDARSRALRPFALAHRLRSFNGVDPGFEDQKGGW
jgi:hypothetical protein